MHNNPPHRDSATLPLHPQVEALQIAPTDHQFWRVKQSQDDLNKSQIDIRLSYKIHDNKYVEFRFIFHLQFNIKF